MLGFIRDNPDGFTVDPDTLEVPNKGFAVAPVKEAEMVIRAENLTLDDVMQFAKNLKLMTEISGKKTICWWMGIRWNILFRCNYGYRRPQ